MKTVVLRIRIAVLIASFAAMQQAAAQTPPPDAGEGSPRGIWGALIKIAGTSVFPAFSSWLGSRLTGGTTGAIPPGGFPQQGYGGQPGMPAQSMTGQLMQGAMIGALDALANAFVGTANPRQQGYVGPQGYPGQPAYGGQQAAYGNPPGGQYPQAYPQNSGQYPQPDPYAHQQNSAQYPQAGQYPQGSQYAQGTQYPQAAQYPAGGQAYPSQAQYPQQAGQQYGQAASPQQGYAQQGSYPSQPTGYPQGQAYPQQQAYPSVPGGYSSPQAPQADPYAAQATYVQQQGGYAQQGPAAYPQGYPPQAAYPQAQPQAQAQYQAAYPQQAPQQYPAQYPQQYPQPGGYQQAAAPVYHVRSAAPVSVKTADAEGADTKVADTAPSMKITEPFFVARNVVLGRPAKPLEVHGSNSNYEGLHVAIVGLDANGKPANVRSVNESFRTGEKFKLRVLSTFDGLVAVENINPNGVQMQVYPEPGNVVAIPQGREVLIPLADDQWFELAGNTGKEQLIITVRDRRAFGTAAANGQVFRQDEKYGSNFVQEVTPGATFPVISQSMTFSHSK